MAVRQIELDEFLNMAENCPILDVRSPAEFKHAHICGAYSLPLFSDEERKVVGTTYKQQNREDAIKAGLDYFGPKMKVMIEEVERLLASRNGAEAILVHCWRGGMRSAGVAWLLDLYGFKVFTLTGGYKSFRRYALELFNRHWPMRILGGYTGSGKTEILQKLCRLGEEVIDLEALAMAYTGVEKAYAIQAGRELRVIVEAEKVTDADSEKLSFEIADKIQKEMQYPGQIKVTVIRELRAVNVAR